MSLLNFFFAADVEAREPRENTDEVLNEMSPLYRELLQHQVSAKSFIFAEDQSLLIEVNCCYKIFIGLVLLL